MTIKILMEDMNKLTNNNSKRHGIKVQETQHKHISRNTKHSAFTGETAASVAGPSLISSQCTELAPVVCHSGYH